MRSGHRICHCCHGYHVYQENWTPIIGEQFQCEREDENPRDHYAVAIKKCDNIVGHVPRNISTLCYLLFIIMLCSLFLRRGGAIFCVVTGRRRYSRDLRQGGMEIPCKYRFVGNGTEIKKVQSYITKPVNYLPSKGIKIQLSSHQTVKRYQVSH